MVFFHMCVDKYWSSSNSRARRRHFDWHNFQERGEKNLAWCREEGKVEGMLGGARVKLIQCRMNRMKGSCGWADPPQAAGGSQAETEGVSPEKESEAEMSDDRCKTQTRRDLFREAVEKFNCEEEEPRCGLLRFGSLNGMTSTNWW